MSLTQVTPDVISTNTISGLISAGFTSMNVATMGTQTIDFGSSNTLVFRANTSTERMRISSAGLVGIGTSNPVNKLDLVTESAGQGSTFTTYTGSSSTGIFSAFRTARGTLASPSAVQVGDRVGVLGFGGYTGAAFVNGAIIQSNIDTGAVSNTSIPMNLSFWTCPDGTVSRTERMQITANGQIAVSNTGSASAPIISKSDDLNTGIFFPAADTIAFSEGGTESMRIDSAGQVGVGVTPQTWSTGKVVEIGGNGCGVWGLASGTTYLTAGYYFNSTDKFAGTGNYALFSQLVPADGSFRWSSSTATGTAGNNATMAERMRIDASGNIAIGSTSPDPFSSLQTRMVSISSSGGGTGSALNITSGAGSRIQLGIGTTRTAILYSDSTNFTSLSTETALPIVFLTNQTERLRIPSDAGGITFPATQVASSNANTLDDYEEGTWTPSLMTGSAQPTFTYTNRGGTYVKIGRQVIAWFYALVSVSSAGNAQVALVPSSLPFTPRSDSLTNSSGSRGGFVTQNPQSVNNVVLTWNNNNPASADALYFTTVTGGSTTSGMASGTYAGYVIYEAN